MSERRLLCRMVAPRALLAFRWLGGWRQRMRGLLGTTADAEPVALVPCSSVHTVGMRYPLDVALVARNGMVVRSRRAVPPGRMVRAPGAHYALERPSCDDPWPDSGSWVAIAQRMGAPDDGTGREA